MSGGRIPRDERNEQRGVFSGIITPGDHNDTGVIGISLVIYNNMIIANCVENVTAEPIGFRSLIGSAREIPTGALLSMPPHPITTVRIAAEPEPF